MSFLRKNRRKMTSSCHFDRVIDMKAKISPFCSDRFFYPSSSVDHSFLHKKIPRIEREAAVLILLRWGKNESRWEVLLTLRSEHLRRNAGEVAFPGGVRETGDQSPIETALRESLEEIGLPFSFVTIIGALPPICTRLKFGLFPVIALLDDQYHFEPMRDQNEVEACFWLPLERFLSTENYTKLGGVFYAFEDYVKSLDLTVCTWGITSYVAILVSAIVYQRLPDFSILSLPHKPVLKILSKGAKESNWKEVIQTLLEYGIDRLEERIESKL